MQRTPRLLIISVAFILFVSGTLIAIKLAKGYRPSFKSKALEGTGLLAVNSAPRGASVFINDKLTTATDDTLNLPPGEYKVKIAKDGFISWEKTLQIEAELVTQTNTRLFPSVPNLKPLTFSGALNPLPSPDGQKIAFSVQNATTDAKNGLYVVDLLDRPFGFYSSPRQISRTSQKYDMVNARLIWSPDSSQILATINPGDPDESNVFLNANAFNDIAELKDVTARLTMILKDWSEIMDKKDHEDIAELPELMQKIATESAAFIFSPDVEKLMYSPNAELDLAENLIPVLPASSTQAEQRHIQPGNIYVYDLIEDKNFWIASVSNTSEVKTSDTSEVNPPGVKQILARYFPPEFKLIQWYPDSRHLIIVEDNKIVIAEYDGTNRHTVYAGPFSKSFSYPWPNGSRLLVLASLNGGSNLPPNLYSIDLK